MAGAQTGRTIRWFLAERCLPPHWAFLRSFLFLFFAGVAFVLIGDLFAWDEHAKRGAARLILPAIDYWQYELRGHQRSGQEKITVVLVDDEDLEHFATADGTASTPLTWPLPYAFHANRLREIAQMTDAGQCPISKPAAIFIDLLFLDERETLKEREALRNTICRISRCGIPVFLASLDWAEKGPIKPASTDPQAAANGSPAQPPMPAFLRNDQHGAPCATPVGVERRNDKFDATVWGYDVVHGKGQRSLDSAALAIFSTLQKDLSRNVPRSVPMALIWGTTTHPFNPTWMRGAGENTDDLNCRPDLPLWPWFTDDKHPLCPYNRVLPARGLARGILSADTLNEALIGRVVMYGMNVQSAADVFRAPLHGELAGVHLHAMALDNMYSFGGQTKREEDLMADPRLRSVIFTLLALAVLTAFMTLLRQRGTAWRARAARYILSGLMPSTNARQETRVRRYALCEVLLTPAAFVLKLVSYLVVALAIAWFGYAVLDLGPIAWAEYALFFILAQFLDVGPRAEAWVRARIGAFDHLSRVGGADDFKDAAVKQLSREDSRE